MTSKIWLVTGAARGLGLDIAKAALAAGHTVIGTHRPSSKPIPSVVELEKAGATWIQIDFSAEDVEAKVAMAIKIHGRIDVLVNNAGYGMAGAVEDTSVDQINSIMKVNLLGPLRAIQTVLPSMREHGGGTIVNIGSSNGITALPGLGIYSATKHALEAATEALQIELSAFNIRVMIVEPGALATDFVDSKAAAVEVLPSAPYKDGLLAHVRQFFQDIDGYKAQAGSPEKAALRIVEAVDGTGMLAGRDHALRLPLGTAGQTMREKGKQYTDLAQDLEDVYSSI